MTAPAPRRKRVWGGGTDADAVMARHARAGQLRLCVSVLQYLGQYASVPIVQQKGQESITGELQQAMRMLLKAYNRRNGHLPRQFVVRPRLCLCAAAPCEAHHAPCWAAGSSPQHLICTGRYLCSNVEGFVVSRPSTNRCQDFVGYFHKLGLFHRQPLTYLSGSEARLRG